MNYLPFLLAHTFYTSKKKYFSTKIIPILSKIGISISVFALLISCSALNGFHIQLNKKILSSLPHGIISLKSPSEKKWKDMKYSIENMPGIFYAERYILMDGLLEKNNLIESVQIKGFSTIKHLKKYFLIKNTHNDFYEEKFNNNIIISSNIAKILCVKKNDWINLIIQDYKNDFIKLHSRYLPMHVKEIFKSKEYLDSNIAFVSLHFLKEHFNLKNTISEIELKTSNPFNIDKIMMHVVQKINSPVLLYTWIETYQYIYHDMQMIKAVVYLSILLVIIISCFSIGSVSFILISKKTKDISILKSMGANNFFIQRIFFYYGFRFIFTGILIGFFTGIATILSFKKIMLFFEKTIHSNILIDNLYIKDFLLLELNILDIIIIFTITIVIGVITNLYPSYYASTIHPIQILKEY